MNRSVIVAIVILFLVVAILSGIFSDYYYANKTIKIITQGRTQRIEIDIITGGNPNDVKHVEILDSLVLRKIDSLLKQNIEITADRPNIHSVFISMKIYKQEKKASIRALNTQYSGWLITFGNRYFKNDSLISILLKQ